MSDLGLSSPCAHIALMAAAVALAAGASCTRDPAARGASPAAVTEATPVGRLPLGSGLGASAKPGSSGKPVRFFVDCSAAATRISPLIYGIAYDFQHDAEHRHQWLLGPTIRRWGGNSSSRYNWELGDASSTAQDWYWENTRFGAKPGFSYASFLDDDRAHGVKSALTIPMLGWVAKDTTSYSFPVSSVGPQDGVDPWKHDAGNGTKGGRALPPPPPSRTSTPASPAFIKRWIEAIRARDGATGARSVHQYILDNEPNLWNHTHRDVHPEPLSYDELVERTIQYGSAIREADPDAVIAGPAEWGWLNYLYSAKDASGVGGRNVDRARHGDVALIPWYLRKLQEHEQRTGVRVLDVLDLHFYAQGAGVHSEDDSPAVAAMRIRSTRALWDPAYLDESWIHEKIRLIPRMKQWIAESYPGRGISIGEWSFGGETRMSGALATAEALGRFGQGGVTSAFYFTYPPARSPAYWAFRAYRDFDGRGGHFLDASLPTRASEDTSIFASRSEDGRRLVLIALNFSTATGSDAFVELHGCGAAGDAAKYTYTGGASGFAPGRVSVVEGGVASELPPYSISVLDVAIAPEPGVAAPAK